MIYVAFLAIIFLFMMVILLLISVYSVDRNGGGRLGIQRENARNPRYFSKAFSEMVEKALQDYDGRGTIHLSKDEEWCFAENIDSEAAEWGTLVVARQSFKSKGVGFYSKEIYASADAVMEAGCTMRAISCGKRLKLETECRVVRWADAEEGLCAKRGCNLGVSATSGERITLDVDCTFKRLFAPEIRVRTGASLGEVTNSLKRLFALPVRPAYPASRHTGGRAGHTGIDSETKHNPMVRQSAQIVRAGEKHICSVITQSNLTIRTEAHVYGDIKSNKNIRIESGAVVTGNVFADRNVVIECGVYIGGVVFSQESIFVGPLSRVGRYGATKSLVAREGVILCEGATIYGYIHCERGGRTVDWETFKNLIVKRFFRSDKGSFGRVLKEPQTKKTQTASTGAAAIASETSVRAAHLTDKAKPQPTISIHSSGNLTVPYSLMLAPLGKAGFRGNSKLSAITLPADMIIIGRGYFYNCKNLHTVTIPDSVRVIDDYAFCGCESLKKIIISSQNQLELIGHYAFDGCTSLTNVVMPKGVKNIGIGAFRGCKGLVSASMDRAGELVSIGGHAFQHCTSLEQVELPPTLGSIGHSLFYGCAALTEIRIPQSVKTIKDFAFYGCVSLKLFVIENFNILTPSTFGNIDKVIRPLLGEDRNARNQQISGDLRQEHHGSKLSGTGSGARENYRPVGLSVEFSTANILGYYIPDKE